MTLSARAYLLDRFRTDSAALHQRAASLSAAGRKSAAPTPGPDADASRRMAVACDTVVAMIDAVPESLDAVQSLASIAALLPLLEHRAAQETSSPAVRAVYIGAATRIREVQAAESRALTNGHVSNAGPSGSDNPPDGLLDEDESAYADDDEHGDHDGEDDSDDDDVDDDDLPPIDRG